MSIGSQHALQPAELNVLARQTPWTVGPMLADEVTLAAEMAVRLLPASLLAQLGTPFMVTFFKAALDHPDTIALTAMDQAGQVVGFCLASSNTSAFQRSVRARVLGATARALMNPARVRLIPSFIRGFFETEPEPHIPAELLLLYVDGVCQRQGSGRALVEQLERGFKGRGVPRYRVAVRSQLTMAKAFYCATGFVPEQERTVLGEPMSYFVREI
jgi:ribosomal protein S18 acetylase RimI-like enzyme